MQHEQQTIPVHKQNLHPSHNPYYRIAPVARLLEVADAEAVKLSRDRPAATDLQDIRMIFQTHTTVLNLINARMQACMLLLSVTDCTQIEGTPSCLLSHNPSSPVRFITCKVTNQWYGRSA
jgi:hypothetical protein